MKLLLAWIIVSIFLFSIVGILLYAAYRCIVVAPLVFAIFIGIAIIIYVTTWACSTIERHYNW